MNNEYHIVKGMKINYNGKTMKCTGYATAGYGFVSADPLFEQEKIYIDYITVLQCRATWLEGELADVKELYEDDD